jgi:hypothetical protein
MICISAGLWKDSLLAAVHPKRAGKVRDIGKAAELNR